MDVKVTGDDAERGCGVLLLYLIDKVDQIVAVCGVWTVYGVKFDGFVGAAICYGDC